MELLLAALKSKALPAGDNLQTLWNALCKALDQLTWRGRVVASNCIAQVLENVTVDGTPRPDFGEDLLASFPPLATALVAMIDESKQPSLRLAAVKAVANLVRALTHLKPGALVEDPIWSRIAALATSAGADTDLQIAGGAATLKVATLTHLSK
jgi:hypothetical protein